MSFASEYSELRKKRKKSSEELAKEATEKNLNYSRLHIAPTADDAPLYNAESMAHGRTAVAPDPEENDSWFKNGEGNIAQNILGTVGDAGIGVAKGILGIAEGLGDLVLYGGNAIYEGVTGKETDMEKHIAESFTDELLGGAEEFVDKYSYLGDKSDNISAGIGQVAAIIATGGIGASAGLGTVGATALTTGLTGLSSMGSSMGEAYYSGATEGEMWGYGAMSGVIDAGTELIFGGLGKAVNAVGLSKGISSLDDTFAKVLSSKISNQFFKTTVQYGVKASAEGLEEVLAGIGSAVAKDLTYMSDENEEKLLNLIKDEKLLDQFVAGAVTSGIAQFGIVPQKGSYVDSLKTGKDFITGYTQNEQAVIDKEYENRVSEAEKDGEKLTKKEKSQIYEQVEKDLEKGFISTDTIGEVLGGATYETYKANAESESKLLEQQKAMQEEYNTLNKMKLGEMTGEQTDRKAELKEQLEQIKAQIADTRQKGEGYRKAWQEGTKSLAQGTRLAESYNEVARRGQAFEADTTKYEGKQAEIVQKAIDSGILNNTNRTHEFVDMIAKISADKGVSFDFTNNEKLKESGFAVNGKTVNGYVTKDGITINIQSKKGWQSVVGHEISHVLEGTELYTEMRNMLFDYAKAKGDFDGRRKDIENLYKNVKDADVDAELTADLVGDYLFTDEGFIANLSTKHRNVFQKIYDEIKYLLKISTAGSKEKRDLERVKKAFDKVYREGGKVDAKGETKYSLTMVESVKPTSDKWQTGASTDEVRAAHPTLYAVDEDATTERNPTQVKGTIGSYRKVYDALQREGFDGTILDASSGLGYGTKAGIEEYGFDVEDIEPYPDSDYKPKYTDYSSLDKTYDVVISNAVLNVLPQDQRDALVVKMGELLNEGGRMFVNVRGKDVLNASGKIAINEANMEYFIPRTAKTGSYQKGFTKPELVAYLQDALGDGYTVEPTNMFGAVSAIVTKDGGVKYSISDSDGKQLSPEQQEYFKDSKVRDENGNLKVMYHGSQDAGFHVFDPAHSDDETSLFFVDRNDVAASYSGTTETYEAQSIRTAEDMNRFIESIGAEGYEVVEKDGKFTLLYEGDRVADSNTAKGIYEEFCWYEGVGEGDANYKVYLNLKNPLEVDAEGRNWNEVNFKTPDETIRYEVQNVKGRWKIKDNLNGGYLEIERAVAWRTEEYAQEALDDYLNNHPKEQTVVKTTLSKTRDVAAYAKNHGYDGVIINNIVDIGKYGGDYNPATVAIAFESNQVKSVANDKPTKNADIRYSLSTDSKGRELSAEQKEFFKDTKIKDENGNLLVMYHGTQKGGFTVFQNKRRPNTEGFYFTNDKKYSDVFEGKNRKTGKYYDSVQEGIDKGYYNPETYEVYLDVKNPFVLTADQQDIIEGIGYWENIYKPIKARGYDGVMMEDMSQVFVFNSNQIKRVDNTNPTSNPDIRYSLTEYTAEEKKAHNDMVLDHFGKTYSWAETGYLLLDGTRLDLSGKHDGAPGGYRTVDHRDITEALGYDYGGGDYSGSLVQFMSEGNIRIIPECNGINLSVKPTKEQEQALSNYISRYRGEVMLDIDDLNGNTVVSVEYPYGTYYTKVLNDIREWFDNGKKPENAGSYSLTKEGEAPTKHGSYYTPLKDLAYDAPVQNTVEDIAPAQDAVAPVGETVDETVAPAEESIAPVEKSAAGLAEIAKQARREEMQGAYTQDGKQYISDGSFIAELNTIDESLKESESFPVKRAQKELDEAFERQLDSKYEIATDIADGYIKVGDSLFDAKYVNAVIRAIENPVFTLSHIRGGDNALLVTGENGRAVLMPVRAGDNVEVAYEAKPAVDAPIAEMPDGPNLQDLYNEKEAVAKQLLKARDENDQEHALPLAKRYNELLDEIEQMEAEENTKESERLNSLTDADAPDEVEAPYYESEPATVDNPFDSRDIDKVGNRKVNAYMFENPEVKPFFQAEANILLGELERTQKPETIYNGWLKYEMSYEAAQDIPTIYRTSRVTTEDIAYLRDEVKMSYADIEKGIKAIIEDHGAENIAAAKKIEFILNGRLLYGYNAEGVQIPPNQDYINLLNEKQITEYSEEARKKFFEVADEYAPMTGEAPETDEIAPTFDTANPAQVEGQQTMFPEDIAPVAEKYEAIRPKREATSEPSLKRVDSKSESPKEKQRKWAGTSTESEAVDGKVLLEDLEQSAIHYQPISNKKTLKGANARLDSMGYDSALSYFNGQFAGKKTTVEDIVLGERLIQEAIKRGDTKTAGELIEDVAILGTELGQKVQALSIIKRLTPEGQLRMLQRTVERGKTKGDKAFEDVEITQEMVDKILKTRGKDGKFDQAKLNEAVEDVKQQIADQMGVTKLEKVNAWRYLSMLGNPKTHIRNLVSNVAMKGTTAVKNVVARTIEGGTNTVAKVFGFDAPIKNRTKTWKRASETVKSFAEQTTQEMKDIIADGGKYSEDASLKEKRQIFKNRILNGMYEFNNDLLSKEDWWFSKSAFKKSFSEYLTANGITTAEDIKNNAETVEKAKKYALEQAQIATFRQYSWLANKIGEIERKNAATNIAVGAVLPFKKTPINIAKTALNYSPLGFAKTLTYDISQVKQGNMEASELIDHLSQNITGSALALVGYMLANAGLLNGAGEDDKEGDYDYQLGEQAYSINIGGATYSLSWLTPVSMPLFVGVNAYEQLVEGKEWNGDVVMETLAQTLDPLSEMSFLSSLDSVLSSYDSGIEKFAGIAQSAAQNYITQFVPTLSSQVATVMDDTKRSTKVAGDSDFKFVDETLNKLKYKIPYLRETLEPTTDIWGDNVMQTEDTLTRAFETFLAPYAKRENIASAVDEEIKSLYSETGDGGLIPSIPYNYVKYKDVKYDMSAEDYTAYKQTYGHTAFEMLDALFATDTYKNADADTRADLVNDVYDYARDLAKKEYLEKQGVDFYNATEDNEEVYKENPIKGAIENDVTPEEYSFSVEYPEKYAFFKKVGIAYSTYEAADEDGKRAYSWAYENQGKYTMSKAIADDFLTYYQYKSDCNDFDAKDENGETVSGLKKERVLEYINNLDIDYGSKIILFRSMYDSKEDINRYNGEIVDYLNSRDDISYEEMVTILKELDFTVHSDGRVTW